MKGRMAIVATILLATGLPVIVSGQEPANPKASEAARMVLKTLHELPTRSDNRLISGHLAGGSIGPLIPAGQDSGYRFKLDEIEYLHKVSGQWVGLIGADYCAGWIKSPDPIEATMYYKEVNRGLIDYWNSGGLVMITMHQFDPRQLHKGGGHHTFLDWPSQDRLDISRLYTPRLRRIRQLPRDHGPLGGRPAGTGGPRSGRLLETLQRNNKLTQVVV